MKKKELKIDKKSNRGCSYFNHDWTTIVDGLQAGAMAVQLHKNGDESFSIHM
jgi:hypothetical protein